MQVREVMSFSPSCCTASTTAQAAAVRMKQTGLGFLPVVDDSADRIIVGVVTDRDLCLKVVAAGARSAGTSVRQCMSERPVCCAPSDDVQRALQLMRQHGFRRLPVVDAAGRILGVITLSDLIHHGAAKAREVYVTLSCITEPGERRSEVDNEIAAD